MGRHRRAQVAVILFMALTSSPAHKLAAQAKGEEQKQFTAEASSDVGTATNRPQGMVGEYIIGADDLLAINVWKEPEISREVPVRPDGKISLPLVGDLTASGLTPVQLQSEIKQRLRNYLAHPEVTVIVQEVKSQKFNVIGEVLRPGSYPLSKPMTVLDAIALAGGFRDFAKTKKIYVLRVSADGSRTRLPFNYNEVIKGRKMDQNVELEWHDTVIVP